MTKQNKEHPWLAGARPHTYHTINADGEETVEGGVIDEIVLTLYVNLQEIATIMCSPVHQEALVRGFLYNEGVIAHTEDIALLQMNATRTVADVFLQTGDFSAPRRFTITSGCGGGISFQDMAETHPALKSDYRTTTETILERIPDLQREAHLYQQVRGVHTAVLADDKGVLFSAEDIGRHNTIDKVAGMALAEGIVTTDKMLLSSGRISSEMATKARHMGIPIVISRTAPTGMAVQLAQAWGMCLIGYARRGSFRVYTHGWRMGL
jgi:FdhD protein